jgi:hypothetical protein
MKRSTLALAAVLAAAGLVAAAPAPAVSYTAIASFETRLDRTLSRFDITEPCDLLGAARGVYLPGYGAIFTAEIDLVMTPILPFVPAPAPSEVQRLHKKKLNKLPALRQAMRQALVEAAASLETARTSDQIVLGVTLFYRRFEMKDDLPAQIVMQAPRQTLLDFRAGRIQRAQLDAATITQELY